MAPCVSEMILCLGKACVWAGMDSTIKRSSVAAIGPPLFPSLEAFATAANIITEQALIFWFYVDLEERMQGKEMGQQRQLTKIYKRSTRTGNYFWSTETLKFHLTVIVSQYLISASKTNVKSCHCQFVHFPSEDCLWCPLDAGGGGGGLMAGKHSMLHSLAKEIDVLQEE